MLDGRGPDSEFELSAKFVNSVKLEIELGIVPVKHLDAIDMPVTSGAIQAMPVQAHTLVFGTPVVHLHPTTVVKVPKFVHATKSHIVASCAVGARVGARVGTLVSVLVGDLLG